MSKKKLKKSISIKKRPAKERAEELKHIMKDQVQDITIDMSRDTVQKEWQFAQAESRNHTVPTKKVHGYECGEVWRCQHKQLEQMERTSK